MYKTVIIGVGGGRAHGHADAYQYVKRGRVVAVCDLRPEPLDAFADKYDVKARYTDYREMFEKERPELAHVSTPPNVRLEVLEAAEAAGVPAVVVEKPLAIQGEDYLAIRDFAARNPKIKVAINHQLQFHPRRQHLQKLAADGAIGDIRFIEASSGMNLAYQGTHSLQAIGAFNPARPTTVFGQVSGAKGLQPNEKEHYAPDQSLAAVEYDNGVQATLRCGENAPRVPRGDAIYQHKRIAVYGMKGYIHWTMWGWESFINGAYDSGDHEYPEEDVLGQAAMTEAMFDWLEDDSALHPLNLERALVDFNVILALYASSLNHKVVALPYEPEANLASKLREALQD
ncbi:MAG: Gfo/Idh/MocA family oxidoreductase [Chloroflexi bacterium]|nr:Gfo/Idh/MocA family oxidoreductase [Chloroflexota bacterium]